MSINSMNNILVTGGAGFIGSNIVLKLIREGYNITVLDNLSPQIHGDSPELNSPLYKSLKGKVSFIHGSVTHRADWIKALKDQDAIIHLASETGTGQSMYEIFKYSDINVNGTALMLDILTNTDHKIKKVVIASSRSIYGEGKYESMKYGIVYPGHRLLSDMENGYFEVRYLDDENLKLLPTDESSKIHPSSVYGITKQVQEQLIMTVCPTIGIAPVGFRYQNVYGPGQSLKNPYTGILSIFSTQILNNNSLNIFEDGKESRDFVYIDDVVKATILGLERDEANGEVFNVGSGVATSVLKVAETLRKFYNRDIDINVSGNYRIGDIRHNYANLSKIFKHLGFQPRTQFDEGIEQFTSWVLSQEISQDYYQNSINEMKKKGLFK